MWLRQVEDVKFLLPGTESGSFIERLQVRQDPPTEPATITSSKDVQDAISTTADATTITTSTLLTSSTSSISPITTSAVTSNTKETPASSTHTTRPANLGNALLVAATNTTRTSPDLIAPSVSSTLLTSVVSSLTLLTPLPTSNSSLTVVSASAPTSTASDVTIPIADDDSNGGLSQTTERLLIAFGVIIGFLLLLCIGFVIYRRRQGYTMSQVFSLPTRRRKSTWSADVPQPYVPSSVGFAQASSPGMRRGSRALSVIGALPNQFALNRTAPLRPSTAASDRTLVGAVQPFGFGTEDPLTPGLDSVRPELRVVNAEIAATDSSVDLTKLNRRSGSPIPEPLDLSKRLQDASNSAVDAEISPLAAASPLPSYLENAASPSNPSKHSHFSWTTSQGPRTPNDQRFSAAVSVESVPRFRTVDSWVGGQTSRLDHRHVQDHLRHEIETELMPGDRSRALALNSFTNVPRKKSFGGPLSPGGNDAAYNVLRPVSPIREDSNISVDNSPAEMQTFPNPQLDKARQQYKHQTTLSDITVFKAHPGTPVALPTGSRVPSAILDQGVTHSAL